MNDIINDKIVVILNGPPRSGKDTAAQVFEERGYSHLKFSSALKKEAHKRYGMEDKPIDAFETLKDTSLMEFDGHTPREVYIDVGAELRGQYGPQIFGKLIADEIAASQSKRFIISDLANMDELKPLLHQPGIQTQVIRLHRVGKTFEGDSRTYVMDPALQAMDVANDGDVELFRTKMNAIANNILHAVVKREANQERLSDRPSIDILQQAKSDIMSTHGLDMDQIKHVTVKGVCLHGEVKGYDCRATLKSGYEFPFILRANGLNSSMSPDELKDGAKKAISEFQRWEGKPGVNSVVMGLHEMRDYLLCSAIDVAPSIDLKRRSVSI